MDDPASSEWSTQEASGELSNSLCVFVARQAILDENQQTFAYELLYRNGWEDRVPRTGDFTTRRMIDAALAYGLQAVAGRKTVIVNFTTEVLLEGIVTLLPRATILQLQGDCDITPELLKACRELRQLGYRLALANPCSQNNWHLLLPLLHLIKVDLDRTGADFRETLGASLSFGTTRLIAGRLETMQDMLRARREGFRLFQGRYVSEPRVLARAAVATVIGRLSFLEELRKTELNLETILLRLKQEPSIVLRLLRLANSAAISASETITSLRVAFLLIAEQKFRVLARNAISTEIVGCCPENHLTILRKARFCELMANPCGLEPESLYLFGMLSAILSLLRIPVNVVSGVISLHGDVLAGLSGVDNIYSRVLRCADTYDHADWVGFLRALDLLGAAGDCVTQNYMAARQWSDEIYFSSK